MLDAERVVLREPKISFNLLLLLFLDGYLFVLLWALIIVLKRTVFLVVAAKKRCRIFLLTKYVVVGASGLILLCMHLLMTTVIFCQVVPKLSIFSA